MPLERLREGSSEVVLDDHWFPIIISTFLGRPTVAQVQELHAWLGRMEDRARERGVKLVPIIDGADAERPDAAARRQFAARAIAPELSAGAIVVLSSPLLRGALTAIGWLAGDRYNHPIVCATMAQAFDHALVALRIHDQPLPAKDPATYVRPVLNDVAASG